MVGNLKWGSVDEDHMMELFLFFFFIYTALNCVNFMADRSI